MLAFLCLITRQFKFKERESQQTICSSKDVESQKETNKRL